jgi:hypothetical protein
LMNDTTERRSAGRGSFLQRVLRCAPPRHAWPCFLGLGPSAGPSDAGAYARELLSPHQEEDRTGRRQFMPT